MKNSKLLIMLLIVAGVSSCSNSNRGHQHSAEAEDENIAQSLHFNAGNPWFADFATYSGMQNIKATLVKFSTSHDNPLINDYNSLGKDLSMISATIIKECTMQGEAHDQLHVILKAMLDNIGILTKTANIDEAKEAYQTMNQLSDSFDKYFQEETKDVLD